MTPDNQAPAVHFFTLTGVKTGAVAREGDHVSGIKLYVSKKSGTKLHLDFTRDTAKALRFDDHKAARQAWDALSMFMGRAIHYQIVKHTETPA